tara:strand:- start:1238 stop:1855 length:618 start_codon:yes stop_codon:yes gene_type:complete
MKKIILLFSLTLFYSCKQEVKNTIEAETQEVVKTTEDMIQEVVKVTPPAEQKNKKPLSPHTETMATIGEAQINIDYYSPGVRGRVVFGGLLAYDSVWQTGAHMATWVETNKDLIIEGETLPKGKYGFFTIPTQGDWTIIFNSNWNQHGKDEYNENQDVLRFTTTPKISETVQEHLEYVVQKTTDTSGKISMSWEKVSIEFPFEVK